MGIVSKKIWKYVVAAIFSVLIMGGLDARPVQAAVKLDRSSMNLCVGDRTRLTLSGTSKKAKWKSSNAAVVKVSSQGTVRAVKAGRATVTATISAVLRLIRPLRWMRHPSRLRKIRR